LIVQQPFLQMSNYVDESGNPTGGFVTAPGMTIVWQDGPLGRGEARKAPNGAFVETVIAAALVRLGHYQDSKFNCTENQQAIDHLRLALKSLESRTARRESAGVEGTHKE